MFIVAIVMVSVVSTVVPVLAIVLAQLAIAYMIFSYLSCLNGLFVCLLTRLPLVIETRNLAYSTD